MTNRKSERGIDDLPPMPENAGGLSMSLLDWLFVALAFVGLLAYNLYIGVW